MLIVTKEKEIELKLKTRLMLLLEERLHIEDTQLFWQKAAQAGNIRILTTAVLILSDGALKKLEDAADLLDAYLEENSEVGIVRHMFRTGRLHSGQQRVHRIMFRR